LPKTPKNGKLIGLRSVLKPTKPRNPLQNNKFHSLTHDLHINPPRQWKIWVRKLGNGRVFARIEVFIHKKFDNCLLGVDDLGLALRELEMLSWLLKFQWHSLPQDLKLWWSWTKHLQLYDFGEFIQVPLKIGSRKRVLIWVIVELLFSELELQGSPNKGVLKNCKFISPSSAKGKPPLLHILLICGSRVLQTVF
jgi:hypothetical protein